MPDIDPTGLFADAVLRWIDAARDELTEVQRTAVDSALAQLEDPYAETEIASIGGVDLQVASSHLQCAKFLGDGEPPADAPEAVKPHADKVAALVDDYNAHLGRAGLLKMAVCVGIVSDEAPVVARVYDSNSKRIGAPDRCII